MSGRDQYSRTMRKIRVARARGMSDGEIVNLLKVTPLQIEQATIKRYYGNQEPGPDDLIDGETIANRIERLKLELRYGERDKARLLTKHDHGYISRTSS